MTDKLWLENAHLRMSVSPQGGCVWSHSRIRSMRIECRGSPVSCC